MPAPTGFAEAQAAFLTPATLALISEVETGFSLAALDRMAEAVAPGDTQFRYRLVPKATLARRAQAGGQLSPEERSEERRVGKECRL